MGWIDDEVAHVAGLEEVHGEAVGVDDVELFDCAVFRVLNARRWYRQRTKTATYLHEDSPN